MVPFDSAVFPTADIRGLIGVEAVRGFKPIAVGIRGVRPVIGVKDESPGVAMETGVNVERFAPSIMGMEPMPTTNTHQQF